MGLLLLTDVLIIGKNNIIIFKMKAVNVCTYYGLISY